MRNHLDGGDAIMEAFRNLGIDYVMSSPGSEWGALWEALARQKIENRDGPTYLSVQHETLAVDLAWGYTTITGRVQAVVLHAGAGLLQGSMGIHGAHITETPMLVLSGEALTYGEREGFDPGRQWYNVLSVVGGPNRLVDPITKWSGQVPSGETLYELLMRAGQLAERTPTGPCYLDVPIECMLQEWKPAAALKQAPPAPKQRPMDDTIDAAARALAAADYPVITTEAGGREPESYAALVALAELLAIPVTESYVTNFSNFPKDHPLFQGFTLEPHRKDADVVVTVRSRAPWYPPSRGPEKAQVIAIDEHPIKDMMVYQKLGADQFVEGDVATSLGLITEAVRRIGFDAEKVKARRARWSKAHDEREAALKVAEEEARSKRPIDPVWLCTALSQVMPADTAYVEETTSHRAAVHGHLRWQGPQSYFHAPSGLGQGIGCALGVKLACRDRTVAALVGDGAFLYNPAIQGFAAADEFDLPIMIVVFNNAGYAAMKRNQIDYYPDGAGKQSNLFYGHPIRSPDFAELIKPFGGFGLTVDDPDALVPALQEGLAAVQGGRSALINVILSR